MCMKMNENILK